MQLVFRTTRSNLQNTGYHSDYLDCFGLFEVSPNISNNNNNNDNNNNDNNNNNNNNNFSLRMIMYVFAQVPVIQ